MAKLRADLRNNNAPARPQHSTKKTEKWETLTGWNATHEKDAVGIEDWSDRRKDVDERAARNKRGHNNYWEPYLCSFTPLCTDIDDITSFKHQSLCPTLDPNYKPKKDLNGDGKFANRSTRQRNGKGIGGRKENGSVEVSKEGELGKDACDECENVESSQSERNNDNNGLASDEGETDVLTGAANSATSGNRDVSSAAARAKRLISISRMNSGKRALDIQLTDQLVSGTDEEESPGLKSDSISVTVDENGKQSLEESNECHEPQANDHEQSLLETNRVNELQKRLELPPRSIKLSYTHTQSNIKLRNPFQREEDGEFLVRNLQTPNHKISGRSVTFANGVTTDDLGVTYETSRHPRSTSAHSDGDLESTSLGYSPLNVNTNGGPLAVTTLKSDRGSDDCENKKPTMSQKQVSLILKKVSLQDTVDVPEEEKPKLRTPRTPGTNSAPPIQKTNRRLNGYSKLSEPQTLVPLGDLLPAVDNTIRHRMIDRAHARQPEDGAEEEYYTLHNGKEYLPYEESLFMLKDNVDLRQFKESAQPTLGPPAFRAQPNKSPLQRAKENTNKRLQGQHNYNTGNIVYTDINRLRWQSSSGVLYSGSKERNSPEGEIKSAPVSGRNEFGTCVKEVTFICYKSPEQISEVLSKRRKPPSGRPLGSHAASQFQRPPQQYSPTNVPGQYSGLITHPTGPNTPSVTQVDLNHIRGKLGPKMTEVVRRRTPGVKFSEDATKPD